MAYHHDLLKQAKRLARQEPRKPTQASLRRAVSGAYYAVFHLLIDDFTRRALTSDACMKGYRCAAGRGFDHGEMAQACKSFRGGTLPHTIESVTANPPIPPDLKMVADGFVTLQEERHRADYNLGSPFTRAETLILVQQAEEVFAAWSRVRSTDIARFFVCVLPIWKRVAR